MTTTDTTLIPASGLHAEGVHFSPSTRYRREREGTFPKRVRLGPKHHAYVLAEIRAWVAARMAERDGTQHAV